jgi:hypothetical protein
VGLSSRLASDFEWAQQAAGATANGWAVPGHVRSVQATAIVVVPVIGAMMLIELLVGHERFIGEVRVAHQCWHGARCQVHLGRHTAASSRYIVIVEQVGLAVLRGSAIGRLVT